MKILSLFNLCAALLLGASAVMAEPFTLATSQVDIAVASGFNHAAIPVAVTPSGGGFDFSLLQVASDAAWVTPSVDAASGKIVLTFATSALTNASSTATITATHGGNTGTFFVTATSAPLSVFKLTDDPFRSRTYGLQLQGLNRGSVVVLDPIAGSAVANVTVGRKPSGLAVSNDGSELFVINCVDKTISVIDLATLQVKETIGLTAFDNWGQNDTTANIGVGPGNIIYYTDGAWAPPLRVMNRTTGALLQTVFINPTSGYGFGDFALTNGKTQLFGWAQYGWTAGWGGSYVSKFTVAASGLLTYVENTSSASPTPLNRDPLETPVLVASDDATVFIKKWSFAPAAINTLTQAFPSDVYSITPGGEIAATSTGLYAVSTGNKLYDLPVATTVQAITSDYSRLVLFNTTTRSFQYVDLFAAIGPQIMGRTLGPLDGSIVLAPSMLQWSSLPGVDRYRVYLGTSQATVAAANPSSPQYLGEVNGPSYALSSALAPGVTYYWRVDAVTALGTTPGNVYSFTVSPISASTSSINVATVRGHANFKTTIALSAADAGTQWQASADQPWVTFTQANGVTPANLEVVLDASALPVGQQIATITLANAGGTLFTLPVKLKVEPLVLTVLKSDRSSQYAYAISEDASAASPKAYLLEIDTLAEKITRIVPVGNSATDLAIHNGDNRIYVPNWLPGSLRAIDKTTFAEVRSYAFTPAGATGYGENDVFRVSAGAAGRIVVEEEDQWIDASIFNTDTGAELGTTSQREGGGGFDPTGRFYYHGDNNSSGAELTKLDVIGDVFTELAQVRVESYSYYGSRTVVVSENGNRIFWNGSCFDANLVEQWKMSKETNATSPDGRYAIGDSQIFDTVLKQPILGMPATTKVSAFNSTTSKLVAQVGTRIGYFRLATPLVLPAPVLSSGTVASSSVVLTWTDLSLETGFTLQQRVQGAANWTNVTQSPAQNTTTATMQGLMESTTYEFRLKADAPGISSAWSNTLSVTTPVSPPSTPWLYIFSASATSVALAWTDSDKESGYVLERSPGGADRWSLIATLGQNVQGYIDTTVLAETSYEYRVKAVLGALQSPYSGVYSVMTPAPAPPATPNYLEARVVSGTQLRLTWNDVLDETAYRLERRTDSPTSWITLPDLAANITQFDDLSVQAGVQYWYRIQAINAAGPSGTSGEVSAIPVNLAVVFQDDFDPNRDSALWSTIRGGVALNGGLGFQGSNALWFGNSGPRSATTIPLNLWNQASLEFSIHAGNQDVDGLGYWDVSEYGENVVVEYSLDGNTWTLLQTLYTDYQDYTTWTKVRINIPEEAQSQGTQLRWRQLTHSGATYDTWALDDITITAAVPPVPDAPPFIITGVNSASSIAVMWVAANGAARYQIERTMDGLNWTVIATTGGTQTYLTDTGLRAATWYKYRVRAINPGGTSGPSSTSIVATLGQLAEWSLTHYGTMQPVGPAASSATGPDGITNLAKFAFNMSPADGVMELTPGSGEKGLPHVCVDPSTRRLRVEFIRRKWTANPGVVYEVQFSSGLTAFAPAGAAVQVTSIDSTFERVVWEDVVSVGQTPSRFARISVSESP